MPVNNFVDSNTVYLDDKILTDELASNPSYTFRIGYNTANVNFSPLNDKLKKVYDISLSKLNELNWIN